MTGFLEGFPRLKGVLDLVNQITRILVDNPDEIGLNKTLDLLVPFLNGEFGVLGFLSPDKEYITAAMSGNVWDVCGMKEGATKNPKFAKHTWKGIWADIITTGITVLENNKEFTVPGGHVSIKNIMGCPIKRRGDVIGYFLIASNNYEFNQTDLDILMWFATWLSPIISNRITAIETQNKLNMMQRSLLDMMNYANMYVLVLDKNMTIQFVNTSLANDLGYESYEDIMGKCWLDFVDSKDTNMLKTIHNVIVNSDVTEMEKYREVVSDVITKNKTRLTLRWFNVRINHTYNWSLSFATPINETIGSTENSIREYWSRSVLRDKTVIQAMKDYLIKPNEFLDKTCKPNLE
jgi:PAS domain-containing protein